MTPLAISLLHPTSSDQARESRIVAALSPKVFNVLYTEGFHHASEAALANNLIQNGFTPDGAKKAAAIYLENISFANLDSDSIRGPSDSKKDALKVKLAEGKVRLDPRLQEMMRGEDDPEHKPKSAELPVPIADGMVARIPYPM